jgi:hypothetical protein
MVILINGAFGIGKTTVARKLSRRLPKSVVFNPELIGVVLQRSGRLAGRSIEDFQDLPSWRKLCVLGIRAAAALRSHVIVPMAFSNEAYLREIRAGIGRFEPRALHFCLVAPFTVVSERLRRRSGNGAGSDMEWEYRRAAECCAAHASASFAERVSTENRTADRVVDFLLARLETEA